MSDDEDRAEDADEAAIRRRREALIARAAYDAAAAKPPMPGVCLSPPSVHLHDPSTGPVGPKPMPRDGMPATCLSIASPHPCLSAPPYEPPPRPARPPSVARVAIAGVLIGIAIGVVAAILFAWLSR